MTPRIHKVLSFSILTQHSGGLNVPTSIKTLIFYFVQQGPIFFRHGHANIAVVNEVISKLNVFVIVGLCCSESAASSRCGKEDRKV